MIQFKDLKNRTYAGKRCTGFQLIKEIDKDLTATVLFRKLKLEDGTRDIWSAKLIIDDSTLVNTIDLYDVVYEMPKKDMDLTLIAGSGLNHIQVKMQTEIKIKVKTDCIISEMLIGMR